MSSPDTGNCAHCRKRATKRCTGCLGAPIYDRVIASTFYCSNECQRADWPRHKSECGKLQDRKRLARAAQLLQAIFYRIRMHAYPKQQDVWQFNSMYVEGSKICLLTTLAGEVLQRPPILGKFPISFEGNDQSHVEAVLSYLGCTEVFLYLRNFVKELLEEDLCSKIEEVNLLPDNPKLQIFHITAEGAQWHTPSDHNVYRVTLKSGDVWAVDPSGAQFGYTNPLSAWHDYQQHRTLGVRKVFELDRTVRTSRHLCGLNAQVYETPAELESSDWVAQKVEKRALAEMIDEYKHGGKLSNMLTGSDESFETAKERFLERLEAHIKSAMERLYSPGMLQELRAKVDNEMAQIRAKARTH